MDLVGIALRQLADSSYQIIGIAKKDGNPILEGVESGDILVSVGDLITKGATMGKVVDALRGNPGDIRSLIIERKGRRFTIKARAEHFL
jgi:C-terminal processing protease CtpA/Prc